MLWKERALVGKAGSAFTGSDSQHGGQEVALICIHAAMLHLGMIKLHLPYTFEGQISIDELQESHLGVTQPQDKEVNESPARMSRRAARLQGEHVTGIASRLR